MEPQGKCNERPHTLSEFSRVRIRSPHRKRFRSDEIGFSNLGISQIAKRSLALHLMASRVHRFLRSTRGTIWLPPTLMSSCPPFLPRRPFTRTLQLAGSLPRIDGTRRDNATDPHDVDALFKDVRGLSSSTDSHRH